MLLPRRTREGEFAVRAALGRLGRPGQARADREPRLALAGAALGIGLAALGVEVLRVIAPVSAARKAAILLDWQALGFALVPRS